MITISANIRRDKPLYKLERLNANVNSDSWLLTVNAPSGAGRFYYSNDGGMGEMERWGDGEMERWRDGEMERWRDGEMERWRDGEMGRWGDGEMEKGRWGDGEREMGR